MSEISVKMSDMPSNHICASKLLDALLVIISLSMKALAVAQHH